jgi:hypothetical protein
MQLILNPIYFLLEGLLWKKQLDKVMNKALQTLLDL